MRRITIFLLMFVLTLLAGCGGSSGGGGGGAVANPNNLPPGPDGIVYGETGSVPRPANAIDVYIAYSLGSQAYMPELIRRFNQASADGTNPVTGQPWADGQRPIYVMGTPPITGSSGTQAQGIVNAFLAPGNSNVYKPTIYQPSVSHWLSYVNFQTGRPVFDLANSPGTALSPIVIGIWEERLNELIQLTGKPREQIGWADILRVLQNGWSQGRPAVFYGHTDPRVSSTGLSTTIMEFYACASANGFTGRRLTADWVTKPEVQACMQDIQNLVRHYSTRTEDFLEYFGQGPDYLDMLGLEETRLLCINTGRTLEGETCLRPQSGRLMALYPAEGTFWHENPFGIVSADWVSDDQRAAARVFTDFVLLPDSQRYITDFGYRPATPGVELGSLFVEANGITLDGPPTTLDIPDISVINAIQESWTLVKRQADVMIVMDISGSMNTDDKIGRARDAAIAFLDNLAPGTHVGLMTFSDTVQTLVDIGNVETVRNQIYSRVRGLNAGGGTELFMALTQAVDVMNQLDDADRLRAVVVLSDGADTGRDGDDFTLQSVNAAIAASGDSLNPVIVVPLAYGADADIQALNSIARSSRTRVISGDVDNITRLLQLLSSYF